MFHNQLLRHVTQQEQTDNESGLEMKNIKGELASLCQCLFLKPVILCNLAKIGTELIWMGFHCAPKDNVHVDFLNSFW